MLVLERNLNEETVIDLRKWGLGLLTITVLHPRRNVRIGIDADPQIRVDRREVFDAIERGKAEGKA